ncbi:MAG: sulfotransferase domain-containing protein, partial [Isosphaeraceae bacterium]
MAQRLRLDRNDPTGKRRLVFVDSRHTRIHDVICGGMYRACSTWQYEVVGHLIERHLRGERLGYLTGEAYAARFAPFFRREVHADVERRSWRVLKSHEGHRCFARVLSSGQALAVYAYRDIRDVVFSLMHKRSLAFEDLLRQGMIHQILVNDRFWRAQPRVLIQRYEELVADPVTAVVQLARHLGLGVTRREAAEIADDFSLESGMVQKRVTTQGWLRSTPEGQRPQIRGLRAGGSLAVASSIPATQLSSPARLAERVVTPHAPRPNDVGGPTTFPGRQQGGDPAASGDLRLGHWVPGRGGRRASIPLPALTTLLSALGAFCLFEPRVARIC